MSQYRKPVPIKPANVAREKSLATEVISSWSGNFYLWIRTLLLSVFLAAISIAIGLYSYRIYENNPKSFVDVMDAIFKQAPPPIRTIRFTAASGVIFAMIFYGGYVRSQILQVGERINDFTKFLAGVVIIAWFDIYLFKIDFYRLASRNFYPAGFSGIVVGQIISVVFLMFLMPLFRKLVRFGSFSPPPAIFSDKTKKVFNYFRYYLLSLLTILLTTYLSAVGFKDRIYYHYMGLDLPIVRSGIFLVAVGYASMFSRPPESLGLARSFSFIRLILGVLCFLGVGFFYGQAPNAEIYLVYVLVALVLSWLSYPVIVLLS